MDSILIYQAANDLVQNTGTRNIKRIARSCSLDILETPRFKDVLGFLSLHFDKPLILINSHLDSQTKQMVCGYALGHYLEHQILMDLHTLNKSLAITDKQICLYEPNAFASHLIAIGFYKSHIVIFCQLRVPVTIDYRCNSTLCCEARNYHADLFLHSFFSTFSLIR